MADKYATIYIIGENADGTRSFTSSRTSLNLSADSLLIDKALMFRDAAKRDGRLFICDLVPKWKRPLLRMLGIRVHN